MAPRMSGTPRTYASHREFTDAVGGVLPGYGGHRPGALNTAGESAFVGVPHSMDELPPGQGTLHTLQSRNTTSWQELGEQYKATSHDLNDEFKGHVSGVKVGYSGHVPGARNHFGSSHEGGVPLREYTPAPSQRRAPEPLTASELRKETFVNAPQLAQSTATRRQYHQVHGASNTAPFGVDEHVRYQTESSRTAGPRAQHGAPSGSRPTTPPRTPPRTDRFEASHLYDRDVFHGSAARDAHKFDVLERAHVPTPPTASSSGHALAPFASGHGAMDGPGLYSRSPGPELYEPPHTYQPAASYHQAWASGAPPMRQPAAETHAQRPGARSSVRAHSASPPSTPPGGTRLASRQPSSPVGYGGGGGYATPPTTPPSGYMQMGRLAKERDYGYSGATQDTGAASYGEPPGSVRPSWDKTAPSHTVESFRGSVGGVIPGYKGHIPQAPQNVGKSDWGSIDIAGSHVHQRGHGHGGGAPVGSWDKTESSRPTDSFRDAVGGVIPGYRGHIPQTPQNVGRSDWGITDVEPQRAPHQRGHGHQGGYSQALASGHRQGGGPYGHPSGLGAGIMR